MLKSVEQPAVAAPDYTAIKQKQQATWGSGNYAVVGTTLQIVGESLCEAADVNAGEKRARCGRRQRQCHARRRPPLCPHHFDGLCRRSPRTGPPRAEAEGLKVKFQTADAEALPFADNSFDVALSTFGIMFAPNHAQSAREISRVVRKGGRIAMANWTPDSFIGAMFKVIGRHIARPQACCRRRCGATRSTSPACSRAMR